MGTLKRAVVILGALAAVVLITGTAGMPKAERTLIIAHRGASGHLPEHTLAAYALAYGQGADIIEPDVVLTRDGVLVCSHDLTIAHVAAVASRFPDRKRADGKWYHIDFDLAELKSLGAALGKNAERVPGLSVATLDELLTMIRHLNTSTGRVVGVIPEPKDPKFHREAGKPIEAELVRVLAAHGYSNRADNAIIQCFDLEALRRVREELRCELRLAYLIDDPVSEQTLREFARIGDGIGPRRTLIEKDDGSPGDQPGLLKLASDLKLRVYPYTFKNDVALHRRFMHVHRVDGVFTDFPDVAARARERE